MRRITFLLLVAVSLAAPAFGQMAAPSLVPATPGVTDAIFSRTPSFVPVNPAVMSWRKYSIGGGGVARADTTLSTEGMSFSTLFEDTYGGYQRVGQTYSYGLQYFHETTSGAFLRFESEGSALALSRPIGGSVTVGGAYYTDVYKELSDGTQTTNIAGLKVGTSMRFLESLYVGLVVGKEAIKRTESGDSQNNWSSGRSVSGVGAAWVSEGTYRFHLEASMLQQGDAGNVGNADAQVVRSDKVQTVVLEGSRDVWVLGLNHSHRDQENTRLGGSLSFAMNGNEFTVGIVPDKGMSLLFHYAVAEMNVDETGHTTKVVTISRALSAVWVF